MKKLIFVMVMILLVSCAGTDSFKVKQAVKERFPDATRIEALESTMYYVIVTKDSSVWFVKNPSIFKADKLRCDSLFTFSQKKLEY